MVLNKKNVFLISLFITIIFRALTWYDSSSIPFTVFYLIYFFICFVIISCDLDKLKLKNNTSFVVLLSLCLYSIVFCYSNIKALDYNDTVSVMNRSLMMVLFVFVTGYLTKQFNCLQDVIKTFYCALATLMLCLFILHVRDINLKATITSFWVSDETIRYRTSFGFAATNIPAEYAMSVILLSFYLNYYKLIKKSILLSVDLCMFIIIVANNSRGTLLALGVILFIKYLLGLYKTFSTKKVVKILLRLSVLIITGLVIYMFKNELSIEKFFANTNRTHFLDNIEAVKAGGRWLMGIGNVSGKLFQERYVLYGVELNYMEIYYIGVFVCSGIVGSIWMLIVILYLLFMIVKSTHKKDNYLHKWIFLIFSYMLFLSLFEGYLFSSSYITSMMFLTIILTYLDINNIEKKNSIIQKDEKMRALYE